MKTETLDSVSLQLQRLRTAAESYCDLEARSKTVRELDRIISVLSKIRDGLQNESARQRYVAALENLNQVIGLVEDAKSDIAFRATLIDALNSKRDSRKKRTKPEAIEIQPNLTNQQIRELLQRNLSKATLKKIAEQRSISTGKQSISQLREAILSFLGKQESYEQLRG